MLHVPKKIFKNFTVSSAAFSPALVILDRAGARRPQLDKAHILRFQGDGTVLQHESRDPHVPDRLHAVEFGIRVPEPRKGAHVPDILSDIDVLKFILPSFDLLMDIVAVGARRHSVNLDHNDFLLILSDGQRSSALFKAQEIFLIGCSDSIFISIPHFEIKWNRRYRGRNLNSVRP